MKGFIVEHSGIGQFNHWVAYNSGKFEKENADELKQIVDLIINERITGIVDKFQELAGKDVECQFSIGEIIDIVEEPRQENKEENSNSTVFADIRKCIVKWIKKYGDLYQLSTEARGALMDIGVKTLPSGN